MAAVLVVALGLFCIVQAVSAQNAGEEAEVVNPETAILLGEPVSEEAAASPSSSVWQVIRLVLVLALAAAAIYGVTFFIRRAGKSRVDRNPHLKILASIPLGTNRFAYVLSVGSQAWLVGAAEGGVSLIAEIGDREAVDAMLLDESRAAGAGMAKFPDFRSLLGRFGAKPEQSAGKRSFSADGVRKSRERLKGL
ncbi:MAG: flagellar biosynthetic protein FliO [Treponema sp.]|jgi:flagellar protein FliO/FliZ|nr:flagellar biosynthetic protein FliO [Treponema sp.]